MYGTKDMGKRIGMAALVCCFGIIVYMCAGNVAGAVEKPAGVQVESMLADESMGNTAQQAYTTGGVETLIAKSQIETATEYVVMENVMANGAGTNGMTELKNNVGATDIEERNTEGTATAETGGESTNVQNNESINGTVENANVPEESEYANLAIADVNAYVNVRKEPNTDCEVVGKMYDGAVAQILEVAGEQEDWFRITSGNVEGYIKAEYFIYGDAAAEVIDEYVTRYAQVNVTRLNVRKETSTESNRIGYVDSGEKVKLLEDCGEWLKVQYTSSKEGYVAAEYVTIVEEFVYAKTLEEEQAEIAARKAMEERQKEKEQNKAEMLTNIEFPTTTYTSNEELRKAIVEYAKQYVGNKYVHGGKSLASGTDCSGFTCFIYADFGYSISRTPGGQYSGAGRSIDYSEIQPGDIICYSSNGGKSCTHVALYIGDGQIVHSANSRKGVIIGNADYDPIIGIRNVID